ncbi:MAG: M4 family metallopeptidase [Bacteroidetes bacterium]|nr:M4 family metallopeptidase [Bacteroidota bacterium]
MGDKTYTPGTPGDALRYMNNPSIAGDPDTYLGPNWYTGAGDNGGVHINSGVQNFGTIYYVKVVPEQMIWALYTMYLQSR